jgi:hypothetical protein
VLRNHLASLLLAPAFLGPFLVRRHGAAAAIACEVEQRGKQPPERHLGGNDDG